MALSVEQLRDRDRRRRESGVPPAAAPSASAPFSYVGLDPSLLDAGEIPIWDGSKWVPGAALDGGGGGGGPATCIVKRPEDFGARRDGRTIHDAAMALGSTTLTAASGPFTADDVGKAIVVNGAGLNIHDNTLSSSIVAFVDAQTVTLDDAAAVAVSGKVAHYGTDDTAAIQQAILDGAAEAQTDGSNYFEVQFSAGQYIAASPTQPGEQHGNAQIALPYVDGSIDPKLTVVLKGLADANGIPYWAAPHPQHEGAVIRTMLIGQNTDGAGWGAPSVIGGATALPGSDFSNVRVVVDGVKVVAPRNPSLIAFDFVRCAQADVPNASTLSDSVPSLMTGPSQRPTNGLGIALRMPQSGNNDSCTIGTFSSEGYAYGVAMGEHVVATRILVVYAASGFFVNSTSSNHGSVILRASVEDVGKVIEAVGGGAGKFPLFIGTLDVEAGAPSVDVDDPNNVLYGEINFVDFSDRVPVLNGAANVHVRRLNMKVGAVPSTPAIPATTVALVNPFGRDAAVVVSGGTVTVIAVDGVAQGITTGTVIVPAGKSIALTYSSAPTWKWTLL